MTREQIEKAWANKPLPDDNLFLDGLVVEFAIDQINLALEEVALIVGNQKWSLETTYAQKVRALKIGEAQ
jgi:hypothetical protein